MFQDYSAVSSASVGLCLGHWNFVISFATYVITGSLPIYNHLQHVLPRNFYIFRGPLRCLIGWPEWRFLDHNPTNSIVVFCLVTSTTAFSWVTVNKYVSWISGGILPMHILMSLRLMYVGSNAKSADHSTIIECSTTSSSVANLTSMVPYFLICYRRFLPPWLAAVNSLFPFQWQKLSFSSLPFRGDNTSCCPLLSNVLSTLLQHLFWDA